MKTNLILFTLFFHFASMVSQPIDTVNSNLFVEKGNKILQFRPNKILHFKKTNGQEYWGKKYLLQDESIIFHSGAPLKPDTILLQDIKWIKGRTFGNAGRTFGGALLTIGGPAIGFFPVFAVAYGGGPAFLVAVPFAFMSIGGISLMLPRKFNTTDKWDLRIIRP